MTANVWLGSLVALPLAYVALARLRAGLEFVRAVGVACAGGMAAVASAALATEELGRLRIHWPWNAGPLFGSALVEVTEVTAPLLLLPAVLWAVMVAVAPRTQLDRAGMQRTALAALSATLAFLTPSPILLVGFWLASNALFLAALSGEAYRRTRFVARVYLWSSSALLALGVGLWAATPGSTVGTVGLWLVVVAVLIRKGIFPFHAWIPEAFDTGRMGPTVRFSAPQLGSYVAIALVLPHASTGMLRTLALLSLITATWGSALALVQKSARRACGYLFVSQSALVLAGLDCRTPGALAGSLVLWFSSALAFSGLARVVLSLEARRGWQDLTRHHGGYEQMPQLAVAFLVLGMACTGFPGTLGFVGQEMLVEGAVHDFPTLGFFVVVASALTGLAVMRMYFSLFCGARDHATRHRPLAREVLIFGALTAVLIAGGLWPAPLVASRVRAARALLEARSPPGLDTQEVHPSWSPR